MQLVLKKRQIYWGGLTDLIAKKNPSAAFEVLYAYASRGTHYRVTRTLKSMGREVAPKILARVKDSGRATVGLIDVLGGLNFRPAIMW